MINMTGGTRKVHEAFFDEARRKHEHDEPFALTLSFGLFCVIVLWLHLRARGAEADRNWRRRK